MTQRPVVGPLSDGYEKMTKKISTLTDRGFRVIINMINDLTKLYFYFINNGITQLFKVENTISS